MSAKDSKGRLPFTGTLKSPSDSRVEERALRSDKCSSTGLHQPHCHSSGPCKSGFSPILLSACPDLTQPKLRSYGFWKRASFLPLGKGPRANLWCPPPKKKNMAKC